MPFTHFLDAGTTDGEPSVCLPRGSRPGVPAPHADRHMARRGAPAPPESRLPDACELCHVPLSCFE